MQMATDGNDNDADRKEEQEKNDHADKERILEEAMSSLLGKRKAKVLLGAVKEKIIAPADEPNKAKNKSTERKETLEALQKVTKERDLVKKRLANVEKELEDKRDAVRRLEKDKKEFRQRFEEVNERRGKDFDKLARLRNASGDDDEDDHEGDDEEDQEDDEDQEHEQTDQDDMEEADGDDGGDNKNEYDDATYDGPKWQTVTYKHPKTKGKGDKTKSKGSAGANDGAAPPRRGSSAGTSVEAMRGRVMAQAKPRVRKDQLKHQQQPRRQRELPMQAGGALPPIDVVQGMETESEAIIADAHRQAAARIDALRASATAAAAAAAGDK